tara:strand:- start:264 stop:485 length:222 start_codon:yes stop_codon:yes gene_type:complete
MATLTHQEVYEAEIKAMKKTIQELESVLENSQTALTANKILLQGLEKNLQDIHKETFLELAPTEDYVEGNSLH